MPALICGSLAYDTIMVFQDQFKNHILPDKVHILNVSFLVPRMRREFGGCAGNIAYNLKLLGGDPIPMATVGQDFGPYREYFEELEIPRQLEGSVNDDARISQLARRAGKRMRYVRSVAAPSPVDFTWAGLFEFGRRQYFQLKVYQPSLWWMALAIPLIYLVSFVTCVSRLGSGELLMLALVAVAVSCNIARTRVRLAYLRERFDEDEAGGLFDAVKGSWWLDPVVNVVHLLIILGSACGREITWAGIRYRVTGPQATEIV